ncbi:hypothetical protein CWE08_11075 [Aliidiomarina iranensis]|uniref:Lipoprotein n=1 Tax=Aliidiomarina iranensis TaxID=1434071 RepID=A0A432VR66_9GAMM|nr:hypothetical protein CWE08_11075 [Aliidiomarina iranensis]
MKKRTRTNFKILVSLICSLILLAGCGQKGPLFIPEPEQQTEPSETQQEEDVDNERN